MTTYLLHDTTTGQTWDYPNETALRNVAKLYGYSHPRNGLEATINGQRFLLRKAR